MNKNQRLTGLFGMAPVYSLPNECGQRVCPDFAADPRLVLRYFPEDYFIEFLIELELPDNPLGFINIFILDTTGNLMKAAIQFLEEKEKCNGRSKS